MTIVGIILILFLLNSKLSWAVDDASCFFNQDLCGIWKVQQGLSRIESHYDKIRNTGLEPPPDDEKYLLITRENDQRIRLKFQADEPLKSNGYGQACLTFRLHHFSKEEAVIEIWTSNKLVSTTRTLIWSRGRSTLDTWETYQVSLPRDIREIYIESTNPELGINNIHQNTGVCESNGLIDFEDSLERWFEQGKTSRNFEFVKRQALPKDSADICTPGQDVSVGTGSGNFLTTSFTNNDIAVSNLTTWLEGKFKIRQFMRRQLVLEFYMFKFYEERSNSLRIKLLQKDHAPKVIWDSDATRPDPLGKWQKIQVWLPAIIKSEARLQLIGHHRIGSRCSPVIDELTVREDLLHGQSDCEFSTNWCNFQNYPGITNSWLVGPGRVRKRNPNLNYAIDTLKLLANLAIIRLSKFLYVDYSGDDNPYDSEALQIASKIILPDDKPYHCVRAKIWIEFDIQKTDVLLRMLMVSEKQKIEFFFLNEPTAGYWLQMEAPMEYKLATRIVIETVNSNTNEAAFVAVKEFEILNGPCLNKYQMPMIQNIEELSCDFFVDLCGYRNIGPVDWLFGGNKEQIFPPTQASSTPFYANWNKIKSDKMGPILKSPYYDGIGKPNEIVNYCLSLNFFFYQFGDKGYLEIAFVPQDQQSANPNPFSNQKTNSDTNRKTIFRTHVSQHIKRWRHAQITFSSVGGFALQVKTKIGMGSVSINQLQVRTGHCDPSYLEDNFQCDMETNNCGFTTAPADHMFVWTKASNIGDGSFTDHTLKKRQSGHVWAFDLHTHLERPTKKAKPLQFEYPSVELKAHKPLCFSIWMSANLPINFKVYSSITKEILFYKISDLEPDIKWYVHRISFQASHDAIIRPTFVVEIDWDQMEKDDGFVAFDDIAIKPGLCTVHQVDFEDEDDWQSSFEEITYTSTSEQGNALVQTLDKSSRASWKVKEWEIIKKQVIVTERLSMAEAVLTSRKLFLQEPGQSFCLRFNYIAFEVNFIFFKILLGYGSQRRVEMVVDAKLKSFGKTSWKMFETNIIPSTTEKSNQQIIIYLIANNIESKFGYMAIDKLDLIPGLCPFGEKQIECEDPKCANCNFEQDHLLCGYKFTNPSNFDSFQIEKNALKIVPPSEDIFNGKVLSLASSKIQKVYSGCRIHFRYQLKQAKICLALISVQESVIWCDETDSLDVSDAKEVNLMIGSFQTPFQVQFTFASVKDHLNKAVWLYWVRMESCANDGFAPNSWLNSQNEITQEAPSLYDKRRTFECANNNRRIEAWRKCDLVADCNADCVDSNTDCDSDEKDCSRNLYRTDFEITNDLSIMIKGDFLVTQSFDSFFCGPTRDHTATPKSHSFAFLFHASDASDASECGMSHKISEKNAAVGSLGGLYINQYNPFCELRFAYFRSSQGHLNVTLNWRSLEGEQEKKIVKLNLHSTNNWEMLRINLKEMSLIGSYRMHLEAKVTDGYLAIDDLTISQECNLNDGTAFMCPFISSPLLCQWELIARSPGIRSKRTDEREQQLTKNEGFFEANRQFVLINYDSNTSQQDELDLYVEKNPKLLKSQLSNNMQSFVMETPMISFTKNDPISYLEFVYFAHGSDFREMRLVSMTNSKVIWRNQQSSDFRWKSVLIPISILETMMDQFRFEIDFAGNKASVGLYTILFVQTISETQTCPFETHDCKLLNFNMPIPQFVNSWFVSEPGFSISDHSLGTLLGRYMIAYKTGNHEQTVKKSLFLSSKSHSKKYCLNFWLAGFQRKVNDFDKKENNQPEDEFKAVLLEESEFTSSQIRQFFDKDDPLPLLRVILHTQQQIKFQLEVSPQWFWRPVRFQLVQPANELVEILTKFGSGVDSQVVAIDDLDFRDVECNSFDCEFDDDMCTWHTPNEDLLFNELETRRFIHWKKTLAISNQLNRNPGQTSGVAYVEIMSDDKVRWASLSSAPVHVSNEKQCLTVWARFEKSSGIRLLFFVEDARKRVRLQNVRWEEDKNHWKKIEVNVLSLSHGQFSQQVRIVAWLSDEEGERQNNEQEKKVNFVVIDSIKLYRHKCSGIETLEIESEIELRPIKNQIFERIEEESPKTADQPRNNLWKFFAIAIVGLSLIISAGLAYQLHKKNWHWFAD